MNRLGAYDSLRVHQMASSKMFPAYPHSVYMHPPKVNDLSLTATAMPVMGLPFSATVPRDRRSDSSALQITKGNERGTVLKRNTSMPEGGRCKPLLPALLRPPTSRGLLVLPPITKDNGADNAPIMPTTEQQTSVEEVGEEDDSDDEDDTSLIDEDSNDDLPPPSILGFEEESYKSLPSLTNVEFPTIQDKSSAFPTTLIQEHYLIEHLSQSAGLPPSGLNPRTNNIVRAYEIKGPLDTNLLQQAINKVVGLHPILTSKYSQNSSNKFYFNQQTSQVSVQLDLSISYEKPSELVTLARRKVFDIPIKQSTKISSPVEGTHYVNDDQIDDNLSIVSYKDELPKPKAIQPPTLYGSLPKLKNDEQPAALVKVKLVTKSAQDFLLVVSFPRVVCDHWSSCLFIQQLVEVYSKLEKSPSYKPSLVVLKQTQRRQETLHAIEAKRACLIRPATQSTTCRLLHRRATCTSNQNIPSSSNAATNIDFKLKSSPRSSFQEVALREHQLLLIRSKEKLWTFWESAVTVTIKRLRGPSRIKVISPLRVPPGFGEVTRKLTRPVTARLRPLTGRVRPVTARRGNAFIGHIHESLTGPKAEWEAIKIEESIGLSILKSFPEDYLAKIDRNEILSMISLCLYSVLLGRCCRGWGGGEAEGNILRRSGHEPTPEDPLSKYNQETGQSGSVVRMKERLEKRRGFKLDVGSFLIGVNVSLRQIASEKTQGLFGPLTNTIGLRVDLSLHSTFADLVLSQWKSLQHCRCNGYFPFHTISDELGLVHGLPVRFSYFYPSDVQQLSNPDEFFFVETSVGVAGKALARFGSCCYINPLNTKMDDSCQLELFMWEGVRSESIDGLLLYQPHLLRSDVIKAFKTELLQLFKIVSQNPMIPLSELAAAINPPFIHSSLRRHRR